jgi:drug/metabolite transporter (DMT)-like permease
MTTPAMRQGVAVAGLAAVLFGLAAPIIERAAAGSSALAASALLYLGAAAVTGARLLVGCLARRAGGREAPLGRRDLPSILAMALLGGLAAPTLLVLGLQRTDSATGSLLLTLEAPLTVLLAGAVLREHLGRRVWAAATIMTLGAILLTGGRPGDRVAVEGGLLVIGAVFAWALDNVVSRRVADREPLAVVTAKGVIGGTGAAMAALLLGQTWPPAASAGALLLAGGFGFGVSLQLYLRAQRLMGAARTASVFSAAPFVGGAAALAVGAPWPGWTLPAAAALMALGIWLHASERHNHRHVHEVIEHEHVHTHDDGHHDHHHDPISAGPHSHRHVHEHVVHEHAHGEDLHHRHVH